jgi:hypothetical protein
VSTVVEPPPSQAELGAQGRTGSLLLRGRRVRRFPWLIVVAFLASWFAAGLAEPGAAAEDETGGWRQTRQGWQRLEDLWDRAAEYPRPALHPAVVGGLEVLLTLTAMLAFSQDPSKTSREKTFASREPRAQTTRRYFGIFD